MQMAGGEGSQHRLAVFAGHDGFALRLPGQQRGMVFGSNLYRIFRQGGMDLVVVKRLIGF